MQQIHSIACIYGMLSAALHELPPQKCITNYVLTEKRMILILPGRETHRHRPVVSLGVCGQGPLNTTQQDLLPFKRDAEICEDGCTRFSALPV